MPHALLERDHSGTDGIDKFILIFQKVENILCSRFAGKEELTGLVLINLKTVEHSELWVAFVYMQFYALVVPYKELTACGWITRHLKAIPQFKAIICLLFQWWRLNTQPP